MQNNTIVVILLAGAAVLAAVIAFLRYRAAAKSKVLRQLLRDGKIMAEKPAGAEDKN